MKKTKPSLYSNTRTFSLVVTAFAFFCLFLFLPSPGYCQQHNFKIYSVEDGIAQSFIYSVCQDDFGYLWIGSFGGGVDRFDGHEFVNFNTHHGLSDNVVYCILKDRQGNMWFGTENGITKYDYKYRKFIVYNREKGFKAYRVWSIFEDNNGDLWLSLLSQGAARFNVKDGTFDYFTTQQGLIDNNVRAIAQDRDGNLWFATRHGVSKYDGNTFVEDDTTRNLKDMRLTSVTCDRHGRLWFGSGKGLYQSIEGKITLFTTKDGLNENFVTTTFEDRNGSIWIGSSYGGLNRFDGTTFTSLTTRQGLSYDRVEDITEDSEGNIWIATQFGLSQYKGGALSYISDKDGLADNTVWSIWQDDSDTMWFATEKGITCYTPGNPPTIRQVDEFIGKTPYPFFEDRSHNLWVGNGKNIFRYDGKTFHNVSKALGLAEYEIFSIFQDKEGTMWFGTQRDGAITYNRKTGAVSHFTKRKGLTNEVVNYITQDYRDNIWLGTNDCISIYQPHTGELLNLTMENGLPNRYVSNFFEDSDHHMWIGTYGSGLVRFTPNKSDNPTKGTFDRIDVAHGLPDSEILSMVPGNEGILWVGTNKGITRLDIREYNRSGKIKMRNYGKEEGFFGIECNQNSVCKDREGNLWFGTIKGAMKYDPNARQLPPANPKTHITGLTLFREKVDWNRFGDVHEYNPMGLPLHLKLPHQQNHITFHYIGIHLCTPEGVSYRVKLEGFDENWSPPMVETFATYSNLSPGTYTFTVQSRFKHGPWDAKPATYTFTIDTPFWQRWWFYILMALLFAGSVLAFTKYRTRKLEKQQRILEDQIRLHTLQLRKEQQKVEQINRELEERVQERTRKLEVANKQLMHAQKMEAIGTLASGVAHDLNNILAGIVSYPELLLMQIPEDSPLRHYAATIKRSGEKAAAIVQDLLTLARRGVDTTEVVDLRTIVTDFLESPEWELIRSYHPGVSTRTQFDERLHNILGSPVHLLKSLMNLISNAAEAMPDGGTITIVLRNHHLQHPLPHRDDIPIGHYVMMEVIDTGMGISPEDIDKIFEPFYTKKKMGKSGTGLGMAVVWTTVNDHNGYITVQSTPEKGTTFSLYFPATQQESEEPLPGLSIDALKGNREHLLVVDDVEEQREVAQLMLTELDYRVETVSSGEEAIAYVRETPVDLLILDMIMDNGIDGLETYKHILRQYPHQKAVIISGYSETEAVKETQRLGAGTYLKKPFTIEQLGMVVKKELDNRSIGDNR